MPTHTCIHAQIHTQYILTCTQIHACTHTLTDMHTYMPTALPSIQTQSKLPPGPWTYLSWDRERPPPSHLCLIRSDMDWTLVELDHDWISALKITLYLFCWDHLVNISFIVVENILWTNLDHFKFANTSLNIELVLLILCWLCDFKRSSLSLWLIIVFLQKCSVSSHIEQ